ncbi:hypothetical protein [Thermosipho affectus]|uniref:hypothetical protein n=1 Tax=Thermosipho affectus TaxID=660294 RepID=UPI000980D97A|nr:hypothetical protein [Thermosipho affectus]
MDEKLIFISGSISIKYLPEDVTKELDKIIENKYHVLVGDAKGVDSLVQKYFKEKNYKNVSVVTVCGKPRNLLDKDFKVINVDVPENYGSNKRELFMVKDKWMAEKANYFLVIWDGKSKGSFNNIINGIRQNKDVNVYLLPEKKFVSKENIKEEFIRDIYIKNEGYTVKEIYEILKKEFNIKNKNEIVDKMEELEIIKKEKNKIVPNEKYKNYIKVKNYKGYKTYKYLPNILEILRASFKNKESKTQPNKNKHKNETYDNAPLFKCINNSSK